MRYLVCSLKMAFMGIILLGEYIFSDLLVRVLVLLALTAIEINLVSIFAEYRKFRRFSGFLKRRKWETTVLSRENGFSYGKVFVDHGF